MTTGWMLLRSTVEKRATRVSDSIFADSVAGYGQFDKVIVSLIRKRSKRAVIASHRTRYIARLTQILGGARTLAPG